MSTKTATAAALAAAAAAAALSSPPPDADAPNDGAPNATSAGDAMSNAQALQLDLAAVSDADLAAALGAERLQALLAQAAPSLVVTQAEELVRLKAPEDLSSLSIAGAEYAVVDGFVSVPASAVATACDFGCEKRRG
jgi:hypothetical protein